MCETHPFFFLQSGFFFMVKVFFVFLILSPDPIANRFLLLHDVLHPGRLFDLEPLLEFGQLPGVALVLLVARLLVVLGDGRRRLPVSLFQFDLDPVQLGPLTTRLLRQTVLLLLRTRSGGIS